MNTEKEFREYLKRIGENIKRIRGEKHINRENLAYQLSFSAANS